MRNWVWLVAKSLGFKKTISEFSGFAFFFGQHKSVGRSRTLTVSADGQDRLIGEEMRYL